MANPPHHSTQTLSAQPGSLIASNKPRQLAQLNTQLARLTEEMSNLEQILRITGAQGRALEGLGGYAGGLFMAASKVLGEESVRSAEGTAATTKGEERAD